MGMLGGAGWGKAFDRRARYSATQFSARAKLLLSHVEKDSAGASFSHFKTPILSVDRAIVSPFFPS